MSFHFRRSVRVLPGVRLNFSRSGVSTTVGRRGLSVNVGPRGSYLNAGLPGTGIGSRTRIDGGRGGSSAAPPAAAGCVGCGGLGMLILVLAGFCSAVDPPSPTPAHSLYTGSTYTSDLQTRDELYAHQRINVRSGPATTYPVVRTLARGEHASVGAADASGWAPVYDDAGTREGYVFRASGRLRADPPSTRHGAARHPARNANPTGASALCGDGTYSYSAHRRGTCSHHGGVASWL